MSRLDLHTPLRELFGFTRFRDGQEQVVRAAVEGHDLLALMPTGSGKSLTYQLAAMLRPEPTLVLSPLIALMKDQLDRLPARVASRATFVNSTLSADEAARRLDAVRTGEVRLLYAAPERLRQRGFVELLREVGIGLVVIDEVHCVSMWGHDFRPDYLFIREVVDQLGAPTVLGMTATATPRTVADISESLGRQLGVVQTSVARPNLRYDVELADGRDDQLRALIARVRGLDGGTAIVYARSRRSCEEIARMLRHHGLPFEHYHAGLDGDARSRVQEAFGTTLQGVVATTAFGMGIDKPDVRLVCLVNYPDSVESYVQMVGRAGRDGRPSETLLLATHGDARSLRRFAVESIPTTRDLRQAYRAVRARDGRITASEIIDAAGDAHDPRVLVGMLERAGLVRRGFDSGRSLTVDVLPVEGDAAARVDLLLERYRSGACERAEQMIAFAESGRCRHAQVLAYFGERAEAGRCESCDVCAPTARRDRTGPSLRELPEDIASTIVDAVRSLRWPLGRNSLVALLRGSPKAPPSARRAREYGVLESATEGQVRRWIGQLQNVGALVPFETGDGYTVLGADPNAELPMLEAVASRRKTASDSRGRPARPRAAPPGGVAAACASLDDAETELLASLRRWRSVRATEDGVPAFIVLHDRTLHALIRARPTTTRELASVEGLGQVKIERYGEAILEVMATTM
ncbi:MAG: ATP-dependent DNA helicase RecQ [Gaiellales bacterium]